MAAKRVVCHSHFPHVRDMYAWANKRELHPTKIKYSARKKGFCFSYRPGSGPQGPAGKPGY